MIGVGTFKTSDKAREYVNQVLDSERLSYGPFTQKFERIFAAKHDSRHGIMTASGTCALLIGLAAMKNKYGWKDGDEVIVPAVTFVATSNIVLQLNMKPVFVDVDPVYYELDPELIEAAITPRTRAMIPVHLFGCPCDMDPIMEIAHKHDLKIIEDSCETMFAKYKGKSVGSFGDVGCFSTYVAHILITGIGGLCTTNEADLAINMRSLMNHGRDSIYLNIDDDKDKSKEEMEMIVKRRFSFVQMGYSFRVTEMEGALGLAQMEEHAEMMVRRRANAHFLMDKLAHLEEDLQLPTIRPESDHSFMMFPIVMKNETKTKFVNYLESVGIETRDMLPLTNQPFYKDDLGVVEEDYPVAKRINDNGFYIACHQDLSEAEKDYIVSKFDDYFYGREGGAENKNALVLLSKGDGDAAISIYEDLPLSSFQELVFVEASDDTKAPAFYESKGFKVLRVDGGKGLSVKEASDAVRCGNVVIMGADGSNDAKDIGKLLATLQQGNDLVIASRFHPDGSRASNRPLSYRSLGNRFFNFLVSLMFRKNITDANNFFRAFRKGAIHMLGVKSPGESALFEMSLRALDSDIRVAEIPTKEKPSLVDRKNKRNRFVLAARFVGLITKHSLGALEPESKTPRQRNF